MDTNGGNLIRLTNNGSNDDHPRWSPNGTKILFQSDRDNPETGNQDIYLMNADGTGQTRLSTDTADDCNAVWSPDGTKIVFQSFRNGTYYQVYTMNADGSSQTNLSNGTAADYQPSWSPNGSKIAFASERDHLGSPSIYSMNLDGSSQTRLTFSSELVRDEQPAWSRDAAKIAFVSTRDSNKEIYLINANGSNPVRLTNTLENDDSPYWSPDGAQIVFRSERERDSYDPIQQLWMMNPDGNNQALLAGNSFGDYSPSWIVNGNQPPVASSGGPYSGVIAQNVPFSAAGSFDPDGSINSYSWTFGDGGTGSGVSPTHTYASAGTFTVTLTVTDNLSAQTGATTTTTVTTAASEQYLANFNVSAFNRQPYTNESTYWNDMLRAAYPNGQSSMLLAVRELGKTLFESADYTARARDNHSYVYDLYRTYLMRDPDASGWAFWEGQCNQYGREQVRRAFDECTEFAGIVSTLTPSGSASSSVSSLVSARVDPFNQPGGGLTARDAEWSVPLLSLPGRAGLDLGLSLSYSSMIWTHSGPYIYFDEDNSWPSPGFHLGFPTIQEKYFDAQAGKNIYLLISGGSRVSLRQLGTSNIYEAADSSYLQLIDNGSSLLLRTTDGTQLSYQVFNSESHCTQIKDRNGNYITVNYDWLGHIFTIIDTLGRAVTFNYDGNANLLSIWQSWTLDGSTQTHNWATFGWTTKAIQPSFSGVMVVGVPNPSTIPVLHKVGLDDGSYYTFEYNAAGQVNAIRSYGSDNVQRAYTVHDYGSPADDCPRLIDTHVWAQNWTGINGVPQEVTTVYGAPGDGSYTITTPDGTLYKEFYGTGYKRGLTTQTEVWSGGVKQKWTTNSWTQDNTGVSYQTNPRVTETNIFDAGGNRRRTTVSYAPAFTLPSGASCSLPRDQREYAADATTVLRRSHTEYRMDPTTDAEYLSRHIIGLPKEQSLYEVSGGETLMSKLGFFYDEAGSVQGDDAPVRHDNDSANGYRANFVIGRANLSSVKRYDITVADNSQFTASSLKYNTAGLVVLATDALPNHTTTISYVDSFSDGNNGRNTLAYPKTVTDADGYSSTFIYNFDFSAVTSKQTPQPNTITNLPGPLQTFAYDTAGRIERVTASTNNAYKRFEYGPNYVKSFGTVNDVADEAYSIQVFDGLGRITGAASNHPVIDGERYAAQNTIYDAMGRAIKQSNPTETTGGWLPTGDDYAGWHYTLQTYDWKGRPLITTNPDGTTKEASYAGCGCAGGEVVTLTDEGTVDGGVPKRRQQKIYSDVLGRTVKSDVLSWQGGDTYSTIINNYNARDQVTRSRQFDSAQGTVPSDTNDLSCPAPSCQQTMSTYDGYGRLRTIHVPEQDENAVTSYDYNPDDTTSSAIDARGSIATFSYNSRSLLTHIAYQPSAGVADTPDASFTYDAAGNRLSLTDGMGSVAYVYDQLSRLSLESRSFTGLGTFPIGYEYNLAGELKKITDPTGASIDYSYDMAGRTTAVTGSSFGDVTQYATNMQYRAWGGVKGMSYGNTHPASASYNSRLQPTHFEIPGIMAKDYQYQADGRLRYSADLLDNRFDRSYGYDHAGRIKEAFSGPLARGEADTNDRPYKEFNQYDAMDHLVGRVGSQHWSHALPRAGVTDSFVNNRNPNWQYDAAGRLTDGSDIQSTFDAAGRATTVVGNAGNQTQTLGYDGEGRQSKLVEVVTQDDGAGPYTTTTTRYSVSSSVIGKVITELDETGQKRRTFVYRGSQVLAWQQKSGSYEEVSWEYRDPSNASYRTAAANGSTDSDRAAEMDPLGSNAGIANPYTQGHQQWPGQDGNYPGFADLTNPDCQWNGMPFPCDAVSRFIEGGAAQTESWLHDSRGWQRQTHAINSHGLGIVEVWQPNRDGPRRTAATDSGEVIHVQTNQDDFQGQFVNYFLPLSGSNGNPQKPSPGVDFLRDSNDFARSYSQDKEQKIFFALMALFTNECSEAFKALGLPDPFTLVTGKGHGLVIGPASLTTNPNNLSYMGIPEASRRAIQQRNSSGYARAFTVQGDDTADGRPRIFLNASAFSDLVGNLAHEMIHGGGERGQDPPWYEPWNDDLSFEPKYQKAIDTCKQAAQDFMKTHGL
jgi:YD repeat-containing protein